MGKVTRLDIPAGGPVSPPSPVSPNHDLSAFSCGQVALDDWLRTTALASEGKTARTIVVCSGAVVVGFYCLVAGSERRKALPRQIRQGLPEPCPVLIIGRLAVDRRFQGQAIGSGLVKDALQRVAAASQIIGARAVLVHAIDVGASAFYARFGFIEFPAQSQTLFLPIEKVLQAAGPK